MHSSDGVFYSQVGVRASAGGLRRRAGSPGFVRSARDGWVGAHVSPSPVDPSWAVARGSPDRRQTCRGGDGPGGHCRGAGPPPRAKVKAGPFRKKEKKERKTKGES
jgi:hypothetical protein